MNGIPAVSEKDPAVFRMFAVSLRRGLRVTATNITRRARISALISAERNSQHLRNRAEIQAPIRLVAIPDTNRTEVAVFVATFFNAHELPLLACISAHRPEVYPTQEAGYQELI